MNIGLLVIGDEILNGKIKDLNAAWLTSYLAKTPFRLNKVSFVRDRENEMLKAIKDLEECSDIILTTGGIGPTKDDLTKEIMAKYHGKKLVECQKTIEIVKKHYERFGKEWDPMSNDYRLIPEDFISTENPNGIAPGLVYKKSENKVFMSAPGVPREFQEMFSKVFLPYLFTNMKVENSDFEIFNIRTFGIPEEKIFFELCPGLWEKLEAFGKLASLPQLMGVDLTIVLEKDEKTQQKKEEIKRIVENTPLKESIWQYGLLSLPELIVQKAKEKNLTISLAESCTGGLSASRLTDVAGSSSVFIGSVVAYANSVKTNILGVKEQTLMDFGAVSKQTALEMAIGAREVMKTDIAVSFTGIAGPGGGSDYKPVGTVAIGLSSKHGDTSEVLNFHGDRLKLKSRFSQAGLYRLLKLIENS